MAITPDMVGSKLYLFNAVKNRLDTDCRGADGKPIVKWFDIYDGQFENETIEDSIIYPAVFFFFKDFNYKSQEQNIQTSDCTFTLFIGSTNIDTKDLGFLNLAEMINYSLQGYEAPDLNTFSVLYRMAERQMISRDNVRIWQIDYWTFLRDANTDRRNRLQLIATPIVIEVDAEIVDSISDPVVDPDNPPTVIDNNPEVVNELT